MKKAIRFNVPASPLDIDLLIRTYYWKNGCYELKSNDGLRFARDGGSDLLLGPKRLDLEIEVDLQPSGSGTEVYQATHVHADPVYISVIDEEYLEAFQDHFRNNVLAGKPEPFTFRQYDQTLKAHSRNFVILFALALVGGLALSVFFGVVAFVIVATLAAPVLAMKLVNRRMAAERNKAE